MRHQSVENGCPAPALYVGQCGRPCPTPRGNNCGGGGPRIRVRGNGPWPGLAVGIFLMSGICRGMCPQCSILI